MKIKIQFTVEVDPKKVRGEFDNDMTAAEIRDYFLSHARDSTVDYINRIEVGTDNWNDANGY